MNLDRLPPHDVQLEIGVLSCCIQLPNTCIAECLEKFSRIGAAAFYDLRHQTVYETLTALFEDRKPVDLISINNHLKERNLLHQIGGFAYLSILQDASPSPENLSYYLGKVYEMSLVRRAIQACSDFVGNAYEYKGDADSLIEDFERKFFQLRVTTGSDTKKINTLVHESIADIEAMFSRQGQISGISTGLADLDIETDGLHGGEDTIIAAYPSVGKTSLAMNLVEHIALESSLPVGVFSAEMSGRSLTTRMICSRARINLRRVRDGHMSEADFPKIMNAAGKIAGAKIHIDDSSDLTIGALRAKARRMVQQFGIKVFVVDYMQLISSPNAENRTNEIDKVSKGMKAVAKEFNVPVICLSQLNEDGKLKGARAIGEDADNVWILKRPEPKKGEEETEGDAELVDLWITKQRNGPRNVCVRLSFLKIYTRFEMAPKFYGEDVPEGR